MRDDFGYPMIPHEYFAGVAAQLHSVYFLYLKIVFHD